VIARFWSAQTTPVHARDYEHHFKTQVVPTLQQVAGYVGSMLLKRTTADASELTVITWWVSLEAIRAFAGADLERAVVGNEALPLLARFDRRVRHFELVMEDGVFER
jgi:heme-degrading monooxygenase HmoA